LPTWLAVTAERALLEGLRGGCLAPVGARANWQTSSRLKLIGLVLDANGQQSLGGERGQDLSVESSSAEAMAREVGRTLAMELLERGAASLIASARETGN
ncbi:MAG TPA: hypothetical protein VIY86_01055, partial [Pirellulaceae bacterium]